VVALIAHLEGPLHRADYADGDRPSLAERVADRHHPVARGHLRRVAELRLRQRVVRLLRELDERAVRQRIVPDQLRVVALVRVFAEERDLNLRGAVDDVVVREDQAVLADDEAGPRSDRRLLALTSVPAAATAAVRRLRLVAGIAGTRLEEAV